jgi:protein-L-isoaspartate(D-aspartate) O-methyltransferase
MIDFAQARKTMVDNQVATSSITDRKLLAAMRRIPRERFVPAGVRDLAYIDRDVPLGQGRVLLAAAPFAQLVQLAAITVEDKVLDVGSGSGYTTAVLAALSKQTVALESDSGLAKNARESLAAEGIGNALVVTGQLQAAAEAPFDVVVVEGVVEAPSLQLLTLLREGGRLVALIGTANAPPVAQLFVKEAGSITPQGSFDALRRTPAKPGDEAFVF